MNRLNLEIVALACLLVLSTPGFGRKEKATPISTLEQYVKKNSFSLGSTERVPGALWSPEGAYADFATDYKAHHVNDLIQIQIVESTVAQSSGSVTAQRKLDATSGISGLAGKVNVGGLNPLLSLSSSNNLQGKGQAATQSSLRSAIAGRVAAVYPNGTLVVEAQRQVTMNNEKQTVILRGLVRPGDVASDNSVLSTSIGNLELELKGKGVISDSTRPPNPVVRAILWLVGF